jgi:hypothetical protein
MVTDGKPVVNRLAGGLMAILQFKMSYIKTCSDNRVVHSTSILQRLNEYEKSGCANGVFDLDECGLDDLSVKMFFLTLEVRERDSNCIEARNF